ncbi:T9SS sorting signal type C domain-containing protein, partial [Flavobacterium lindanitolerans]
NNIVAYKQNGSLVINSGNYVMENIELYDMSGRLIYTKNNIDTSSAVIANLPIANQVLVVKITTAENGTANKKIVY